MEMPTILLRFSLFYHLLHSLILSLIPTNPPPPSAAAPNQKRRRRSSDLRQVFDTFDANKDGVITKAELSNSLLNLGIVDVSDPDDIARIIEKVDSDGDGCVNVAEFETLYGVLAAEEEAAAEERMRDVFGVFDKDGDGFISDEELKCVLETLGLGHGRSLEDCRKMIGEVDVDGDGRVSFSEFLLMMKDVMSFVTPEFIW